MAICEQCSGVYEAKRSTSRYCGDKCRNAAGRLSGTKPARISGTGLSGTTDSVPLKPDPEQKAQAGMDAMGFRRVLPDYVPDIIQERYARDSEYRTTIHRLIDTSVPDLQAAGVFIPVWRYQADIAP